MCKIAQLVESTELSKSQDKKQSFQKHGFIPRTVMAIKSVNGVRKERMNLMDTAVSAILT